MNCFLNNFRKKIFGLLLLHASPAYCQLHELIITDTMYIESHLSEDSVRYFSFKNTKGLKGQWLAYYDREKQHMAMEAVFNKGKLTGSEKQWYENGQLLSEKKCVNDTCTTDYFYEDGVLMQRNIETIDAIKKTTNRFFSAAYCDNGQTKYSPPLNPDSPEPQFITSFYCSGKKKGEYTLLPVEGKLLYIGPYTEWYENGQMKMQGYYESAKTEAGKKMGYWNYYKEDGQFTLQEHYENGKVIDSMKY